ncbi:MULTISPECIES: DNA methyltransferase [Acetobacter]|uniref:DNA methyltransferase n=1 Tax=Acetobacter TaxID=434 RepID=UPI0026D4BC80
MTGNSNTATDFRNTILNGDSVQLMRRLPRNAVDFILTDPPYLVNYQGRDGRKVRNDDNARWLRPAFNQMHRVLKWGGFAVSFYGWNRIDLFADAWKAAGFVFPARAGMNRFGPSFQKHGQGVPRTRGDEPIILMFDEDEPGYSPHTRGDERLSLILRTVIGMPVPHLPVPIIADDQFILTASKGVGALP